jgi:hypothetical protein
MIDIDAIAPDVLRLDTTRPGFALIEAGPVSPAQLRQLLVDVAHRLIAWYEARHGHSLGWRSLNWFSQLSPTRPHRDGGPDASILLLGYEPTPVRSRVFLLDYSRAAASVGLSPREFLDRYNPTFGEGAELLKPFTTQVAAFEPSRAQLLLVNNGSLGPGDLPGMLGVLHHASVDAAPPGTARPISSVLLGIDEGGLPPSALAEFVRDGTGASA